jgi:acyl-CoA reductase-like NAD-dependent aldehyde dehydrogenase
MMTQVENLSFDCIVDGAAISGASRDIVNPATGHVFARCSVADAAMVDRAVAGANRAQADWATSCLDDRRALLAAIADAMDADLATLARLLVLEQGKILREAEEEVQVSAYLFRHYAEMDRTALERLFEERHERHLRIRRPLGVAAGIVPWNYPLLIVAMKVAPALLTGNAMVVKPAPTTPLATLRFGRLCADLAPPGLIQVLADDGPVGALLTRHPGIHKIAFTGSTATGARVMQAGGALLKRMTLELGGNDAAIILDDVDVAATASAIHAAAFTNAGQICGAAKRIYVHDAIHDRFCDELGRLVAASVVGDGLDPRSTMGPVQNALQYDKAMRLHAQAGADGHVIATAPVPAASGGFFVPPTLFGGLGDDHDLVQGEQFAPLLPLLRFGDVDDAVRRANATAFGLTASVWSGDRDRALQVARRLDAAAICINAHNDTPLDVGLSLAKQSGIGWLMGEEGLHEYLQTFTVVL